MSLFSLCICFPPSSRVLTSRGQVKISDLGQADKLVTTVRDPTGKISCKETPFLSFIHFDPELKGTFLVLRCENESELIISEEHLIFKVLPDKQWKAVRAKDIQVQDELIHFDGQKNASYTRVVGVDKKVINGVYAPLSMKGTIIVNSILTSCYANINSHEKAHAAYGPFRCWQRLVSKAFKASGATRDKGQGRTNKVQGIHKYARVLMTLRAALPSKVNPD